MKKLIVSSALLAATTSAFAQTEKGSLLVGSSLSELRFGSSAGGVKNFSLALSPTAGVFVVDRLAVGATVALGYSGTWLSQYGSTYKTNTLTYGLAPFARYYLTNAPKHKFFGQAQYGVFGFRAKYPDGGPALIVKDSYTQLDLSLGYDYFISPMVALEVQPYYQHRSIDVSADMRANQWGLAVGFQIFFPKTATASQ